jgi:hypothetical protein
MILAGCGVLILVCCGGAVALVYFFAPGLVQMVQTEFTKAMDWEQFAQTWQAPPPDADAERLFPAAVGEFKKETNDEQAAVPSLEIVLPGRRATYRSGQETIEVFAYPRVRKEEREALFNRLNNKAFTMKMKMDTANFARFTYSTGKEKGILWWSREWLFLARGAESSEPEIFLRAYLAELANQPAPDEKDD